MKIEINNAKTSLVLWLSKDFPSRETVLLFVLVILLIKPRSVVLYFSKNAMWDFKKDNKTHR